MMSLISNKSKILVLCQLVLAFVLSQILVFAVSISNYGASTAMAMFMTSPSVQYLDLYLPKGTQGYIVKYLYNQTQEASSCVSKGIVTQTWDKTSFAFFDGSTSPISLPSGTLVTVFPYTKSDCSDNPKPPSTSFNIPFNASSNTCRIDLIHQRVSSCSSIHTISVNTMIVWPPANGNAVKFIYDKQPEGICNNTKPLSWGDNASNTFITHTSVGAGSKIEFIAYTGNCKSPGSQLVDYSFTVPAAGTAKNSECWINLQQWPSGAISGCTNGY